MKQRPSWTHSNRSYCERRASSIHVYAASDYSHGIHFYSRFYKNHCIDRFYVLYNKQRREIQMKNEFDSDAESYSRRRRYINE